MGEPVQVDLLGRVFAFIFVLLLGFTVGLMALSFPAGFYAILGPGSGIYSSTTWQPYLLAGPYAIFLPINANVDASFVLLSLIYLAMFVYLLTRKRSPGTAILDSFREGAGALLSSPFFLAIISACFLVFTSFVIGSLAPVTAPSVSLLGLTAAPVIEEVGFRVLLIGVVTALLCLGLPWKQILAAIWRPSSAYAGENGVRPIRGVVIALLLVSSLIFGVTHILSGYSFDKLYGATYGGLVLGYLYIRYGFVFAVIAHWGIDYFSDAFAFFGQTAYGIPANGPGEFFLQRAVDLDMTELLGFASFLLVVYLGVKRILRAKNSSEVDKDLKEGSMFGI